MMDVASLGRGAAPPDDGFVLAVFGGAMSIASQDVQVEQVATSHHHPKRIILHPL
jgi:hypothetical protein